MINIKTSMVIVALMLAGLASSLPVPESTSGQVTSPTEPLSPQTVGMMVILARGGAAGSGNGSAQAKESSQKAHEGEEASKEEKTPTTTNNDDKKVVVGPHGFSIYRSSNHQDYTLIKPQRREVDDADDQTWSKRAVPMSERLLPPQIPKKVLKSYTLPARMTTSMKRTASTTGRSLNKGASAAGRSFKKGAGKGVTFVRTSSSRLGKVVKQKKDYHRERLRQINREEKAAAARYKPHATYDENGEEYITYASR